MSAPYKWFALFSAILVTIALCLWPNFHPEQAVLKQYYWQADVLIHSSYFFGLTFLIASLRFNIKLVHLFLLLGTFSILLELLQSFSYKRGVSLMDGVDNLLGIGLALLMYKYIKNRYSKKQQFE